MNDLDRSSQGSLLVDSDYASRGLNDEALDALTRRPRRDLLAIVVVAACALAIAVGAGVQAVRSASPEFAVETLRHAAASRKPGAIKPLVDRDGIMAQARSYVVRHLEFSHAYDAEYRSALRAPRGREKLDLYLDYKLGGLFDNGASIFSEAPSSLRGTPEGARIVRYPSYKYIASLDEIEFILGRTPDGHWRMERISNESMARLFPDDKFLETDFRAYLDSEGGEAPAGG